MAVGEKRKHDLYVRVTESFGPEHAETLMEMLQPTGDEIAATRADFDELRAEFNQLRRDVQSWLWMGMAVQTAVIGLLLAIVR